MIIYRILSFIVSFFCAFLAMNVLFGIFFALTEPMALLICFLFACVVLYGWFANRFFANVVIAKKRMTRKQKDWLQVNAIVAFIFSLFCIIAGIEFFINPGVVDEVIKQMPAQPAITSKQLMNTFIVFFSFCVSLFIHVIWTYTFIRKNKEFFDA